MKYAIGASLAVLTLSVLPIACGGGGEQPTATEVNEAALEPLEVTEEAPEPKLEALPWTLQGLKDTYTVGTKIVYSRSGTTADGGEAAGVHTFEVTEVTELIVGIDSVWEDGGRSSGFNTYSWDDAVFLESNPGSDKTEFEVLGNEQVETPVGTFDTVVVEVTNSFFEARDTYWLISDQPGVYAKWVDHGKVDDEANIVMTLQEVIRPGS